MNKEQLCPQNFQIWVAFLMGMVVIIIAIVLFDSFLGKSRVGMAPEITRGAEIDPKTVEVNVNPYAQTVSAMSTDDQAWLGIEPVDITEDMAKQMNLSISRGVFISRVIENSPAEKAGLLRGDIIYEFDHRDVKDSDHLQSFIEKMEPDDRVKIGLFRSDNRMVLYAFLGERQYTGDNSSVLQISGSTSAGQQQWGLVISEVVSPVRSTYGIPDSETGVIVLMVIPGSPADQSGIQKGDLIKQVNQRQITRMSDFFLALQDTESKLLLNIYRKGFEYVIVVAINNSIQSQQYLIAQEGIGMNRPIYVPGYDQTQSGEPDTKTSNLLKTTF
jgi:S1-C subfamily serine protease